MQHAGAVHCPFLGLLQKATRQLDILFTLRSSSRSSFTERRCFGLLPGIQNLEGFSLIQDNSFQDGRWSTTVLVQMSPYHSFRRAGFQFHNSYSTVLVPYGRSQWLTFRFTSHWMSNHASAKPTPLPSKSKGRVKGIAKLTLNSSEG